jgi:glycosyltransferase involved in cell wall biosynthesis
MANGAVPLSTPVGDVPRHMENGKNGYVTSSLEEEVVIREMLGKLKEWVGDRKVLEVLSTNAFEYASMHFRKERFEQEYRELLRKQSGPL